ncbi:autotransporter outer membrane beta-barrel domain-containing protein [Salmonella enterica]|nr:autotransporter outer membrane beta-barrel domain-containing protein [Salmonella enterica]
MAVENKFKRNVLAASILVGLSLSAASGVAWAVEDNSSGSSTQESAEKELSATPREDKSPASETSQNSTMSEEEHTENADKSVKSEGESVDSGDGISVPKDGNVSNSEDNSKSEGPGVDGGENLENSSSGQKVEPSVDVGGMDNKDENEPGIIDKVIQTGKEMVDSVKEALGGDTEENDNTGSQSDEANIKNSSEEDVSTNENNGKDGVSGGEISNTESPGGDSVDTGDNAPAPETGGNAPAPETGGNVPAPEVGDNAPAPEVGDNAPAPEVGDNAPAPEGGDNAPAPEAGGNVPAPETKPGPVIVTAKDVISSAGKPLASPLIADISTSNGVLTIGESAAQGKKATPFDIWKAGGNAVELTGSLSTAAPGGTGKDDKIVVQNANIHNSLTDKVNTLAQDMKMVGLSIKATTVNSDGFVAKSAPNQENILLDNVNIALSNNTGAGSSTAIALDGSANHVLAKGGVIDAGEGYNASILDITGSNNVVDFVDSTLKGNIKSEWSLSGALDNTVNLKGSKLTGNAIAETGNLNLILDGSTWVGGAGLHSPDVSLRNGSVWDVTGSNGFLSNMSSVNSLNLYGDNTLNLISSVGQAQLGGHGFTGENIGNTLHVDTDLKSDDRGITTVNIGTYSPGTLHRLNNIGLGDDYKFGQIQIDGLAQGGKYRLNIESSGAEPYTIGGRLAEGAETESSKAHAFVEYNTSENRPVTDKDDKTVVVKSDADFTSLSAPAELGVYQYAAEKVMDATNNRTNIYYRSTGQLSNSAATVVSLAAAPVDVANLESDTLAKHMNSVRHGKDSGVWVSYFGGESRNTTAAGPEYTLKTNGVMLGADTLTENNWLAGVAVSSARSDMSVMNSSGDLNSYGAQFYMSRRYDSGMFVDSALQFNHFSNTAKSRMIDGQQAKADFSGNSYGLEAKVGYAWNDNGFFAEPYVRAAARAFDGEHYNLSNGMTVNSNDYKSMLGEVGADVGYQYDLSGGYVKPYLHLAALNEFADGNSVRVNNVSLDNSVKGSAFQVGVGAELKMTDNLGGYAAFDYTKGDNTERPWQATVGVNYTW